MPPLSNLVANKMPQIIENNKNYHLSKRPWDAKDIQDVEDGFLLAIKKLEEEKHGQS